MRKYQIDQFVSYSRSRRRGQALLLSVVIMIFIVLLGTTFIAIVSSNMSNTARTGSKDEARQAAKAGITFADNELTGSDNGLDWRPTLPATPGSFYYTSFDNAQGWSQPFYNLTNNSTAYDAQFVKYPNPQGSSPSDKSANFMIRVSQVQSSDPDNSDYTKTGDIRIESIGFANDDPSAYYKVVAYKSGPASNPLTAAMRSVSNWNFTANTIPQGYMDITGGPGSIPLGSSLQVTDPTKSFDNADCPFYVTISTLSGANNVAGAGVTAVSYSGDVATLTLDGTVTVNLVGTSTGRLIVQKAAALGAPANVKFDNATDTPVDYRVSGINNLGGSAINSPGSVWVNGGLVWFGANYADNLVAPTATTPGSIIRVSGLFSPYAAAGATVKATGTNVAAETALPTSSLDTNYASNPVVTNGLVDDGLNRLRGSLDPSRQVQPFTPPDITAGGDGFGRYRQLTQYSTSIDPLNPQASAYGYGQGIYINNPTDVEKVGSTAMTQTQLHDLWFGTGTTNYNRLGTPDAPTAIPNPALNGTGGSLEEQHLRGWVSSDQFLPRGAEVVLNDVNPPTITITLDARSDNDSDTTNGYENLYSTGTTPADLVPGKMWHGNDGTVQQGVYSKTFLWPADGTLFAEGNIRIRGKISSANSPANSLTVVSMNNIYIEGSLSAGTRKVLLLAKKNVTVNPTQVLDGTEVITTLANDVAGGNTINVSDGSNFQAGDYITINDSITRNVTAISGNTLTLDGNALGSYTTGQIVHTVFDPTLGGTALPSNVATRLATFTQAMTRRLRVSASDPTNIRLAFRHSAEYKKALTVQIDPSLDGNKTPGTRIDSAELNNKAITTNTDPVITADKKYLQINYKETPIDTFGVPGAQVSGSDTFADNLAATPYQTNTGNAADLAAADNISIGDLYKQMLDKYTDPHWDYGNATGMPPTVVGTSIQNDITHTFPNSSTSGNQWVYIDNIDNTVDPNAYHRNNTKKDPTDLINNDYKPHPLFYFMASVGNRKDFGAADPASYPINQQVYPATATPFIVPMATSMWLKINGIQATLQGNQWDSTLGNFFKVLQFGFSPLFVNQDNTGNPIVTNIYQADGTTTAYSAQAYADMEDTLTSDQYFYQPYGKENVTGDGYGGNTYAKQTLFDSDAKYTLDSRLISDPAVTTGATNVLVLQLDDAEVGGHPLDYYYQNSYQIPFYRISNLKLQNETPDPSTHELNQIGTGTTFDINAYVYAQEGGWYVIPGTDFDKDVINSPTDPKNDLNRDGVISQGESIAAYRYHRYNYQIVFTGAIMENQTASVIDVGDWTDKWATVNLATSNFSGGAVTLNTTPYNSANPFNPSDPTNSANSNFGTIAYFYDPAAAQGALNTDTGFHEPVAPGLIYQG